LSKTSRKKELDRVNYVLFLRLEKQLTISISINKEFARMLFFAQNTCGKCPFKFLPHLYSGEYGGRKISLIFEDTTSFLAGVRNAVAHEHIVLQHTTTDDFTACLSVIV